jgi:hypothetical protein
MSASERYTDLKGILYTLDRAGITAEDVRGLIIAKYLAIIP